MNGHEFIDGTDKAIGVELDFEIQIDIYVKYKTNKSTRDAKSIDSSIVLDPRLNKSQGNTQPEQNTNLPFSNIIRFIKYHSNNL